MAKEKTLKEKIIAKLTKEEVVEVQEVTEFNPDLPESKQRHLR